MFLTLKAWEVLLSDELQPLPEKISCGSFFFGVDVTCGEDIQSQEIGEPEGAPPVIDLFEALVLLDGRYIGEMNAVACVHKSVDEPVPIEGGLYHHALDILPIRFEGGEDSWHLVPVTALVEHLVLSVYHRHVRVC